MSRFQVTPTVSCWITDEEGKILVLHRYNTGYMDGCYCLPGGHVEEGETLKQAAVREVSEETSLQVHEEALELFHVNQATIDGKAYIRFVFRTSKFNGYPTLTEPERFDDIGFYEPSELNDFTPADKIILRHKEDADVAISAVLEEKDGDTYRVQELA